jgi:hypothetical protein
MAVVSGVGPCIFAAAKQLRAAIAIIPGDAVTDHKQLLSEAVYLAQENRKQGGRPFSAVLTVAGKVVATRVNNIMQMHDVSAHAGMAAWRTACRSLGRLDERQCVGCQRSPVSSSIGG